MAIVLDTIKVPLQKTDEFDLFSRAVKDMASQRPNDINLIVAQLTDVQKKQLHELLKTKRIVVGGNIQGVQQQQQALNNQQMGQFQPGITPNQEVAPNAIQVPRKIVKVKRKFGKKN